MKFVISYANVQSDTFFYTKKYVRKSLRNFFVLINQNEFTMVKKNGTQLGYSDLKKKPYRNNETQQKNCFKV